MPKTQLIASAIPASHRRAPDVAPDVAPAKAPSKAAAPAAAFPHKVGVGVVKAPLKPKKKRSGGVDMATLSIDTVTKYDPKWRRKLGRSQFHPIFSKLHEDEAVKCKPEDCNAVANAMRAWARGLGYKLKVQQVAVGHEDGLGRVFARELRDAQGKVL